MTGSDKQDALAKLLAEGDDSIPAGRVLAVTRSLVLADAAAAPPDR